MARIQPRLLADIVDLFDSDYVTERLRKAKAPEEVMEAISVSSQKPRDVILTACWGRRGGVRRREAGVYEGQGSDRREVTSPERLGV